MEEIGEEKLKSLIHEVMDERDEQKASYYVEEEKHYNHHTFLDRLLDAIAIGKKASIRTLVGTIIFGILGAIWLSLKSGIK